MIIVGELINASRKKIHAAIVAQDGDYIAQVAREEAEAGADFIDVNAGMFVDEEADYLKWLTKTVQGAVQKPASLDSPDPKAIAAALEVHDDSFGQPMLNSISLEKERWDALLPVLKGTEMKVVALCMSDDGMPETADQRLAIADKLVEGLTGAGVKLENIYVDPLVQPVGTNASYGVEFLNAIDRIMTGWPGINTMCGLSNISYGLPERKFMNQTFMTMAIARGLSGAIINPLDKKMMANIVAAEALAGKDNFCMNYLKAYRAKMFEF